MQEPVKQASVSGTPIAVWVLGFNISAQATSEIMLVGMLSQLSESFGVGIATAGSLISIFAFGLMSGSLTLGLLSHRWPRRPALFTSIALFTAAHVAAALCSSFEVLQLLRFVAGFAYSGAWVIGSKVAIDLAGPGRRSTAMSSISGGLALATALGMPLGTLIGQQLGWRGSFWAVAAMSAISGLLIWITLPSAPLSGAAVPRLSIRGFGQPRLWLSYLLLCVASAGLIGTLTYIPAMLVASNGLSGAQIPPVLLGYGIGAVLGTLVGGPLGDRAPNTLLGLSFAGMLLVGTALALFNGITPAVVVLTALFGFAGFVPKPTLNGRTVGFVPYSAALALSGNVIANNCGIVLGPWLAGLPLAAGLGYTAVMWVGAGLSTVAFMLWLLDRAIAVWAKPETDQPPSVVSALSVPSSE